MHSLIVTRPISPVSVILSLRHVIKENDNCRILAPDVSFLDQNKTLNGATFVKIVHTVYSGELEHEVSERFNWGKFFRIRQLK